MAEPDNSAPIRPIVKKKNEVVVKKTQAGKYNFLIKICII